MKLYQTLENQIKKESNYVSDNGEVKKWVVLNKAQNFDEELIGLLLDDSDLKEKFFIKVKDVLIFNQNLFIQFLEQKNYLNDSYTQFKNKIGLSIDGKYMKQRNEVALVWPFKDCVLEGGQSREEDKREEIFFNETLAQDEITELLDPKVFTNAKLFDKDGEKSFDQFNRNENGTITDNLIIKGNNLLALHSLKKEFAGKVKLIYIDPPYYFNNTVDTDSFKYNSNFKLSTWLTFMKNRLEVSKSLLKDEGFIFIQIKTDGYAHLKILADSIFGSNNLVNSISVKMSESSGVKMAHVDKRLANVFEHILVYSKSRNSKINPIKIEKSDEEENSKLEKYLNYYSKIIIDKSKPVEEWEIMSIDKYFEINNLEKPYDNYKEFKISNANKIVYRTNNSSFEKLNIKKKLAKITSARGIEYIWWEGKQMLFLEDYISEYLCDLWLDISTINLNKEGGVDLPNGKKPEKLIERIINLCTTKNDIVLDYHLGSGTTAAVAHKMERQYIGLEQIDYGDNDCTIRINNVIRGEQGGISKSVNWQGGGSFIYLELKKYNQIFIEKIEEAENFESLLQIWEEMKTKSFLNYNIDIKKQEQYLEDFKALNLKEQKQHLCELLNKNQLYVNLSSLNDGNFECTPEENKVTKDFYQIKK
ncbi:site-specific DNA-methyltransferase [Chryseobacterium sp. RP-3-3]|uniref:site-specific DNA-methyltransferase (adenine-specific) n=1 Tax=Chryseobacterium antibioticum TaxID=2728847 RepID=A0A7Y0AQD9_9FLAO|nr:site-specific DNA-methyltransferase [Chryseobacterium antibioticum]NML71480.1 site-specific DNA-methyltransferase [Chryseobacterium antibioticum]